MHTNCSYNECVRTLRAGAYPLYRSGNFIKIIKYDAKYTFNFRDGLVISF